MIDILHVARETLMQAEYSVDRIGDDARPALVFEGDAYLGFVLAYPDVPTLQALRVSDANQLIARFTPELRLADEKAWNVYVVWLAQGDATEAQEAELALLEEDLAGTRKVAAGGIETASDVEAALANLLPLKTPPALNAVDVPAEIRSRTTELDPRAVQSFLSGASASQVAQALQNLSS